MKKYIVSLVWVLSGISLYAQVEEKDSLETVVMEEVIIISKSVDSKVKESKILGSIDNYLENSPSVNMIKRGAYAWEPMLQGMATERSVITLDGMRIYGACTDKMDPVTSYVEISNFVKANISSGQAGAEHGGTIAGSIDLVRKKAGFSNKGWSGTIFSGFETGNNQIIAGTGLNYSKERFYTNVDFTFRDADNYKAGGNEEIMYSQFTKYNASVISGVKLNDKHQLEASFIFDRATDVGYPALPMDVSLAQAFIGSVEHKYFGLTEHLNSLETKFYYNNVKHKMDDTTRPVVPIRMDMPGWSKTWGMYSKLKGKYNEHQFSATLSGHFNNSLAEMTMFPNDPKESDMFMLTWPDVNTMYGGLFMEDKINLNHHLKLMVSAGIGTHFNSIESEFGIESLRIFYSDMNDSKLRILKNVSSQLSFHHGKFTHSLGMGYGERAPSVSEGYGFYLFNSFDAYDYVGNPFLKNEKSLDFSLSTQFKAKNISIKWQGNYFRIFDYILGIPDHSLLPMTIGAHGIKRYEALEYVHIFNTDLEVDYTINPNWTLNGSASYRFGEDLNSNNLPLIQPFNFRFGLRFQKENWIVDANMNGSAKHSNYNSDFGETPKDSYVIANVGLSKNFNLGKQKLTAKVGAENLFDENYSTFSDWNNIPRMGRNMYINLVFEW